MKPNEENNKHEENLKDKKISDEAAAEQQKTSLLQLQAESAIVEASGHATAEARALAESMSIQGEAAVKQAELAAEAEQIQSASSTQQKIAKQTAYIIHQRSLNDLEILKARDLAQIEADKFKNIIDAVGSDIIEAVATAGPQLQVELLQSLKLKSFMVTDGNSPINLFNTAHGLIGNSK